MSPPPPSPTLFPYTTLFRSDPEAVQQKLAGRRAVREQHAARGLVQHDERVDELEHLALHRLILVHRRGQDRKSTRLNSSHEWISYAVFCLKKKKKYQNIILK